ncbi:uncharacterized protein JCM6883_003951 [Sporobolomyces salmoneus]|uniref:uncharacterized protein n=1 Tax=Sporobolomyces salmoneus TaxID=183962 RepID=UPI00317D0DDB
MSTSATVLGTILFHRVLGQTAPSTNELLNVSFPVPAEPQIEALIEAKSETFTRLLDGTAAGEGRSAKLFVACYPIPLPPLPSRTSRTASLPSYPARTSSPAPSPSPASPSRTREPSTTRRTSLAAPAFSALNWLSSARAALGGESTGESSEPTEQDEELSLARAMERNGKGCWEMWSIEIEVLRDGRRSGIDGEEKLRSQLNDFLLRSLSFVMHKTAHVPPITSSELIPYGILILLDPSTPPVPVPKPVLTEVKGFPALHKALVNSTPRERKMASAW